MTARRPLAPVGGGGLVGPIDLGVLQGVVTSWLRVTRHGSSSTVCWSCPVDAAGLVGRVDAAIVAGLL